MIEVNHVLKFVLFINLLQHHRIDDVSGNKRLAAGIDYDHLSAFAYGRREIFHVLHHGFHISLSEHNADILRENLI